MPLPLPARTLLQSLRNGTVESAEAIRALADAQLRSPATVSIRRRASQIAFCALLPVLMPIVVVAAIYFLQRSQTSDPGSYALKACVNKLADFEKRGATLTAKQLEERDLIEVYIAEHLKEAVEESAAVARSFPAVNRIRGEHALALRALANHPQRSPEQVTKADAVVAKLLADQTRGLAALNTVFAQWNLAILMVSFTSAFVGALAILGALVARGGFTFRPFGAALVTKDGGQASRARALLRAVVSWSLAALACWLVAQGPSPDHPTVGWTLLLTSVVLFFMAAAIWAILHPSRGIQDRIAGTWVVPR